MDILFFVGNGFDINLGMKTRYSDFYKYYRDTESKSDAIKELKENISGGIINWSDLELAFGKYTTKIKGLSDFDEVYEDIVDNLADYLTEEEKKTDLDGVKLNVFLEDLIFPEKYLAEEDTIELLSYRRKWENHTWNLNIVTLNYTRSVERILNGKSRGSSIGHNRFSRDVFYRNIHHIHGYTDRRIVLGLNDLSQIDNVDLHDKEEIIETLIKTKCNQVQRHNVDKRCEGLVEEADLICIFGSSIGDTDNHWWKLMGDQLRRGCRIIIFSRGENIQERFGQKAARSKRSIKSLFLKKTDLTSDEMKQFEGNVYVGMNTLLFNIM